MSEQQLSEFYDRVARYERARSLGFGFESDGTLGRSHSRRPKRRSPLRVLFGVVTALFILLALKAGIILFVGQGVYAERIDQMNQGAQMDKLGAAILKLDPVSTFMVDQARVWGPKIMELARAE